MTRDNAGWQKVSKHDNLPEAVIIMLSQLLLSLSLTVVFLGGLTNWAHGAQAETEQAAELLATLLNAGRVVVEQNQSLINDPRKGDKGFTPEVFERSVLEEFSRQTHLDLRATPPSLPASTQNLLALLLRTSKEVVADAQFVINQRGIGYKNFIPATFGSQAARKFSARSKVTIKQTALDPRNLHNAPDAYEQKVLLRLATQPTAGPPVIEWLDGGTTLRVMTPLYYSEDCLTCHGSPKGILDISGYPREGAQAGALAGAISIHIPLDHR
jgi:general secretion pathway protein A